MKLLSEDNSHLASYWILADREVLLSLGFFKQLGKISMLHCNEGSVVACQFVEPKELSADMLKFTLDEIGWEESKKLWIDNSCPALAVEKVKSLNLNYQLIEPKMSIEKSDSEHVKNNFHRVEMALVYGLSKISWEANRQQVMTEMIDYFIGQQVDMEGVNLDVIFFKLKQGRLIEVESLNDQPVFFKISCTLIDSAPKVGDERWGIFKGLDDDTLKDWKDGFYSTKEVLNKVVNKIIVNGFNSIIPDQSDGLVDGVRVQTYSGILKEHVDLIELSIPVVGKSEELGWELKKTILRDGQDFQVLNHDSLELMEVAW